MEPTVDHSVSDVRRFNPLEALRRCRGDGVLTLLNALDPVGVAQGIANVLLR